MKFSVLLRYPDYASDDWPDDTYAIKVTAKSYLDAVKKAQQRAFNHINKGRPTDEHLVNCPDDLALVCAVEGDHDFYRE